MEHTIALAVPAHSGCHHVLASLPMAQRHLVLKLAMEGFISEADAKTLTDDALSALIDFTEATEM